MNQIYRRDLVRIYCPKILTKMWQVVNQYDCYNKLPFEFNIVKMNPKRISLHTSVFSEYEQGNSNTLLTQWLQKIHKPSQSHSQSSPRFQGIPRFGRPERKPSIQNFTLGQIDDLHGQSRVQTFPSIEVTPPLPPQAKYTQFNKENNSLVSNTSQASQASKSFVSAMKALQEKCRRLEADKGKGQDELRTLEEATRKNTQILQQTVSRLQIQLEQKALETVELKSRITLLEKASKDTSLLITQTTQLKDERTRLQRKWQQSQRCCVQLSDKYAHVVKQYEVQCRATTQAEDRVKKLEKQVKELDKQMKKVKERNIKLEKFEHQSKTELVERYNSVVGRNQQLGKLVERLQKDIEAQRQSKKSDISKIELFYASELAKRETQALQARKQKELAVEKCSQMQANQDYLRQEIDRKNQEMLDLMKSVFSKQVVESKIEECRVSQVTQAERPKELPVFAPVPNPQPDTELNTSQRNEYSRDQGYRSVGVENRVTGRFEDPHAASSLEKQIDQRKKIKKSNVSVTSNKPKSLEKSRKKSADKATSKSVYTNTKKQQQSQQIAQPNLVTFQNPYKQSRRKNSRRVVYAASQPRQPVYNIQQPDVRDFMTQNQSQFCEIHHPVCYEASSTVDHQSEDINKMMLIETEKEAINLYEEHEQLLMAFKDCATPSERSEFMGRLKQLNQQIKMNSKKICELKALNNSKC